MNLLEDIERRAERISTLFFKREDIKHRFLTETIARELKYLLVEMGLMAEEEDTSYKSPSPKTQSDQHPSGKG